MFVKWLRRAHPALFAVFPVLALAAQNPGRFTAARAGVLCLVALAAVGLAYVAAYAVQRALRRPNAADRAALVTLAGVCLFYGYPVFRWFYARVGGAPRVLAVGAIVSFLVATVLVA